MTVHPDPVMIATEGALWGAVVAHARAFADPVQEGGDGAIRLLPGHAADQIVGLSIGAPPRIGRSRPRATGRPPGRYRCAAATHCWPG